MTDLSSARDDSGVVGLRESLKESISESTPSAPRKPIKDLRRELQTRTVPRDPLPALVGQKELGPPGLRNTLLRADIRELSETERTPGEGGREFETLTAEAKGRVLARFKQTFPEGDLFFVPGETTLLFQEDPSKPFAKVDADFLEGGGREVINDVVEFMMADFGAITGETAAQFVKGSPLGRGAGAVALIGQAMARSPLLKGAVGAFLGQFGQEEVQRQRGIQQGTRFESAQRAAVQGLTSAVGGAVADKATRGVVNALTGRGLAPLRRGGAEVQQGIERIRAVREIDDLPVNLLTNAPIIRKIGGQSGALVSTIADYVDQIEVDLQLAGQAFLGDLKTGLPGVKTLQDVDDAARSQIMTKLANSLSGTGNTFENLGAGLRKAVVDYSRRSNGMVNMAYAKAREQAEPKFDLFDLRDEAAVVLDRAEQLGPDGAGLVAVARKIGKLDDDLAPRVVELPSGETVQVDGTDRLNEIRSQLFDLKIPAVNEIEKAPQRLAGRLFGAISKTLDEPIFAEPGAREAWRAASDMARKRFETLERQVVVTAAKTENPTQLAARLGDLSSIKNVDDLAAIRRVVPNHVFADIQDASISRLLDNPDGLTKALDAAHPEVVQKLLAPKDLAALRQAGADLDKLNAVGVREALERQSQVGAAVEDVVIRNDTARIDLLKDRLQVSGGKDSEFGRTMRAGIVEHILGKSKVFEKGAERIDFKRLRSELELADQRGVLDFLTPGDRTFLRDVRNIQDVLRLLPDAGTSIQAAEAAAGVRTLQQGAILHVLENVGVGRLFTSNLGRQLLIGSGGRRRITTSRTIQTLGGAAALLATDPQAIIGTTGEIISALTPGFLSNETE